MRLKDKVVLITGAAQGIGWACAERFGGEGAQVVLVDAQQTALADACARLDPKRVLAVNADVSRKAEVHSAVAQAVARFGRIDVLVNNAGIVHSAPLLDLAEEDFDRVLAVNLKGYFLFGQAVARHMIDARIAGAIVNMSSVNAVLAIPDQVPYVVSKGAVNQLTRVMAVSLAPHGIRVNGIGPGTISTELARRAVLGSEAARRKVLSRTPLGRMGEPDEVARVAVFLASEDSAYMTGQIIYPDGGRLALNYTIEVD